MHLDPDAMLEQRFRDLKPGLNLITIQDGAVPVTEVGTDVLAQERKALPLLDEFVLRLVSVNVTDHVEIAAFLGVSEDLVDKTLADQFAAGTIRYSSASRLLGLTPAGKNVVTELAAIRPTEKQLSIVFDRLTWSVTSYPRHSLMKKGEAEGQGYIILPASRTTRISTEDITAPGVNALLQRTSFLGSQVEVLRVKRVHPFTHRYFPAKLLIYSDGAGDEIQIAVVIEDSHSQGHDLAIASLGGAVALGIQVAPAMRAPDLGPEVDAIRLATDAVGDSLRPAVITEHPDSASSSSILADNDGAGLNLDPSEPVVRSVAVFEHRELLSEALQSASSRLLIVSPWIRSAVVDTNFLARLEQRLRAGVAVTIAHGYGDDDDGSDRDALRKLGNLQNRFSSMFNLARLKNTHAKILIFDQTWVATSFNWLSFRGDPSRTYRMEEGTMVRIPTLVDREYERYIELIKEQSVR
jgi:hypothetical protein